MAKVGSLKLKDTLTAGEGATINDATPSSSTVYSSEKVVSLIPTVSDVAYNASTWDANTDAPTKNAVRDKFESLSSGGLTQAQVRRLNA